MVIPFSVALARLGEIMEAYAAYGASDTEPCAVAMLAVSNALAGDPVIVPMSNLGWDLYDDAPAKVGWLLGEALDDMVKAALAGDPEARIYARMDGVE